jgi:hypothetical protein
MATVRMLRRINVSPTVTTASDIPYMDQHADALPGGLCVGRSSPLRDHERGFELEDAERLQAEEAGLEKIP